MPDFQLGFADLATQLGSSVVGAPLSEEFKITYQLTTKGLMQYTPENGSEFVAARTYIPPVSTVPVPNPPAPNPGTFDPDNDILWIGSQNYEPGRGGYSPVALVLHTMEGSLAGSDSWFNNPVAEVSAHFGVGLDGAIHQYVSSRDTAWANGSLETGNKWSTKITNGVNPNYLSVSVETEDLGDNTRAVTAAQYSSVLNVCSLMKQKYPSIKYLSTHAAISPQSRAGCPGPRWVGSGKFAALAKALGLTPIV